MVHLMRAVLMLACVVCLLVRRSCSVQVDLTRIDQMILHVEQVFKCNETVQRYLESQASSVANQTKKNCPAMFDGVMCINTTEAGITVTDNCPYYVHGFETEVTITRTCSEEGKWINLKNETYIQSLYAPCQQNDLVDPMDPMKISSTILEIAPKLVLVSMVGHPLSILALSVSLVIMGVTKRLHCSRNYVHMNLFLAYIVYGILTLIQDITRNGRTVVDSRAANWECRLLTTLWRTAELVRCFSVLIEGLYLNLLIFFPLVFNKGRVRWFVAFCWSTPLLFVIPWAIARLKINNFRCWMGYDSDTRAIHWILEAPTLTVIVINFFLFINIIRVLFIKLNAANATDVSRNRKLAKSTLLLIPLFGITYVVFAPAELVVERLPNRKETEMFEVVRICFDLFISAFQGFFVAFIFCFLNGEVQTELKKKWSGYLLTKAKYLNNNTAGPCTHGTTLANDQTAHTIRDRNDTKDCAEDKLDGDLELKLSYIEGGVEDTEDCAENNLDGDLELKLSYIEGEDKDTTDCAEDKLDGDLELKLNYIEDEDKEDGLTETSQMITNDDEP